MSSKRDGGFLELLEQCGAKFSVKGEGSANCWQLGFHWRGEEFVLDLYPPRSGLSHCDIGLCQLERVSQGMDPEQQNLFYWHVTSILRSINERLEMPVQKEV